jgi:hypothetical protein
MFEQFFSQIKAIISGLIIGATTFLGIQTSQPSLNPNQEHESEQEIVLESTFTATPSATPTIKPKTSPTPTSTPEIQMDLNLEGVTLLPEKIESLEEIERRYTFSGNQQLKFRPSNRIKEMYFRIRNNGHEDAKNVAINVIVDGDTLSLFSIDLIEKQTVKNEKKVLSFPDKIGKHKIELQVNPGKAFPEIKFDNNTKIIEYEYLD